MLITKTPLRISLFGGGTDFKSFYEKEGGAVLSTAIDKYIYITVKERYDESIRVSYTKTEIVNSVDELEHELIKESLRMAGLDKGLEIITMGDIPAGSGLGSSSAVTVGSLNAFYTIKGEVKSKEQLARKACEIEIDILKKPIGIQDQIISSFGGFNLIEFNDTIKVNSIDLPLLKELNKNLLLFFTGKLRSAESILFEQQENISKNKQILLDLKYLAYIAENELRLGNLESIGYLLDESWSLKKELASKVSNEEIDNLYSVAKNNGAIGGKILGAGGGGFLLLYCPYEKQKKLKESLSNLKLLDFKFESEGSKIIFNT